VNRLLHLAASKHAVIGLTKSSSEQHCAKGIRINAVCPGLVWTEMTKDGEVENMSQSEPVKRIGQPEEVAEAVLWLASKAASFVTGVAFPVDGGYTQANRKPP
jgi:NAD(P)-dependent dehydrogenase (short-subunit alcohol dehydrogenase family)